MAAKPSNNRRKMGGNVSLPAPREGKLPPVKEATSALPSAGSRTQAAGTRSGCGNASRPPGVGNPRAPAAKKSTSLTSRETRSQSKGVPSPPGRADSDARAAGKTSSSANQHGRGGNPNLEKIGLPASQEGALPPVKEATGAMPSAGTRTQAAGARSGCGNASRPPHVGSPRAPAARKSASPTSRETRSQSKGVLSPPRRADSDTRAAGKTSSSANQHGRGGNPNLEKIGQARIAEIERETRGQRENPEWFNQRRYRITASAAHKISRCKFVNGRSDEVPQSYLKPIVGQGYNVVTPAMKWGIDHEPHGVTQYQKIKSKQEGQEVEVQPCGLSIDPARNWLAASPDGLVVDKATKSPLGLLEVKCPYKHRYHSIAKACEDKDFCLESGDKLQLKKKHPYFTQMQCQMAVTGMRKADLVVYTSRDTAVVPVDYDEHFWLDAVEKLEDFYTRAVLPEKQKDNTVWAREE